MNHLTVLIHLRLENIKETHEPRIRTSYVLYVKMCVLIKTSEDILSAMFISHPSVVIILHSTVYSLLTSLPHLLRQDSVRSPVWSYQWSSNSLNRSMLDIIECKHYQNSLYLFLAVFFYTYNYFKIGDILLVRQLFDKFCFENMNNKRHGWYYKHLCWDFSYTNR